HEAFVTLVTTNTYCKGAKVVAQTLRRHGTTRNIVAMCCFVGLFSYSVLGAEDGVARGVMASQEVGLCEL
ncbi:hypothetical protein LDENG_00148530, partial [Lucifuga dentata]